MDKKSPYNFSIKEMVIGVIIVAIMVLLGKWAYIFLPPEYAEKTQIPNMEVIFGTSIAVLFIVIYKIVKEINEIKKQLDTKKTDGSSELNKNLD